MALRRCAIALALTCLPALAPAAGPQLKLPAFEHLQRLATDSVNLSIGAWPLGLAAGMLGHGAPEDSEFAELVRGLKGIYIRSYEFAADGVYPAAEVDAVREQLAGPDWSPVTQLRGERRGEKVDIFVCMNHGQVSGLAVIASDPRRFTILNVVGSIDPRRLTALEHQFGLPELGR